MLSILPRADSKVPGRGLHSDERLLRVLIEEDHALRSAGEHFLDRAPRERRGLRRLAEDALASARLISSCERTCGTRSMDSDRRAPAHERFRFRRALSSTSVPARQLMP